MPKKMKLNLEELNVQSFVTLLDSQEVHAFRGGSDPCGNSEDCEEYRDSEGIANCFSDRGYCYSFGTDVCCF